MTVPALGSLFGQPGALQRVISICRQALDGRHLPIPNPLDTAVREDVLASDLILGRDEWAMNWLTCFRNKSKT